MKDLFSVQRLDGLRQIGDPSADLVVQNLYREGRQDALNRLWDRLLLNRQLPPREAFPELHDFFEESHRPPRWVQIDKLRRAECLFRDHGPAILLSLLCSSLPECYIMQKGAGVLYCTGKLVGHPYRRLIETAQYLISVLAPGGMIQPTAGGATAATKVRLLHASIRAAILEGKPDDARQRQCVSAMPALLEHFDWDVATKGVPINQEDLVLTLLTFSHVILRSLMKLGIRVDAEDYDAWHHSWAVTGHYMGIQKELLESLADPATAARVFHVIRSREGGTSVAGVALTQALVRCIREQLPGYWLPNLTTVMIRHLVDPTTAEWLKLRHLKWTDEILWGLFRLGQGIGHSIFREVIPHKLATELGSQLVRYLTRMPAQWERDLFDLPEDLAEAWKIPLPGQKRKNS